MAERVNSNYKQDYKEFLCGYILPLLGLDAGKEGELLSEKEAYVGAGKPAIEQSDGYLRFYVSEWQVFSLPCRMPIPDDDIALVRRILQSFPHIARYKMTGSGRLLPNDFPTRNRKTRCMHPLYKAESEGGSPEISPGTEWMLSLKNWKHGR